VNPHHVDLTSLRVFVAVAQSGSISAGAEAISLSIAAVSKRITDLEAVVGTLLFRRTPSGMALSPAGHSLLQHALQIQQGVERMAQHMGEFAGGVAGQVRILATSSALVQGLPAHIRSFCDRHPNIRVDFEERLSGDVIRSISDRRADIGIFTDNVPHDGLVVRPFDEDEMVLVASVDHPIAALPEARLADALEYDFVSQYDSTAMNHALALAAAHSGRTLKLRSLVRGYDSVCRMVAAGLGLGLVPASFELPEPVFGKLVVVHLKDAWVRRRLLMGVRAGETLPAAVQALFDHLAATVTVSRP
jgi:DNA-binding transcriptional LysR family regulator